MSGVLLDKKGRVERPELLGPSGLPVHVERNLEAGWSMPAYEDGDTTRIQSQFERLPPHVLDSLERAKGSKLMNSGQGWRSCEGVITSDTTLTAAAEAIMVPDFLLQIPGPRNSMVGVTYKYTLVGEISAAVTTPGTFTPRLRYGGVAGVLLHPAPTALAPTGTQVITATGFTLEWRVTFRTVPSLTTATAWCQGQIFWPGMFETTPASTTIMVAALKAWQIPAASPAVSASLDVTAAKALSPTWQPSLGTASITTHLAFVESLN